MIYYPRQVTPDESGNAPPVGLLSATGPSLTPSGAGNVTHNPNIGGGGGGLSLPYSATENFSGDLSNWTTFGDGTQTIDAGKLKLASNGGGNGATWNQEIPATWTSIEVESQIQASYPQGYSDCFIGIADVSGDHPHGGLDAGSVNAAWGERYTGTPGRFRVGKNVNGAHTLLSEYSQAWSGAAATLKVLFTKSGDDIRVRCYDGATLRLDETITLAALNAPVYVVLATWGDLGRYVLFDDFTVTVS